MNSDYLNFDFVVKEVLALCRLPSCDVNISRDRAKVYEQYMLMEKANSLAEKYPWLVEEWDYERNGNLTPWQISHGSQKRIHWICRKCGYRWETVAHSRKGSGCPCCANRVIAKGINDLCTTHPQLAQEWDDIKNEKKPDSIGAGSHQYAWWRCQCGHSWKTQIKSRAKGTGCPMCKRKNAK
jgi:rubrerythrin